MKKKELRDRNGLTEAEFLSSYEPGDYVRPSVAADMVIFTVMETEEENYRKLPEKELEVLLIQRGVHPYLGCWALPGGFVRPDEPTGNLDAQNSMEIMRLLEEINNRGTTVVVVTHSQEIVNRMGKRVITLDRGVVAEDEIKGGIAYEA